MIGTKIKAAREVKGISQEYMAAKLQITQPSYSRLESGIARIDVQKLKAIADILDLDALILINDEIRRLKKIG